jgi:two-component system sensor histidine kinase QseC
MKSLRLRLLLTLLPATILIWLVAGIVSYGMASHEAVEMLDGQLAQSAKLLMAQVHHEKNNNGSRVRALVEGMANGELHPYEQPLEFQIWGRDGTLWLRSGNAPAEPLARQPGYRDILHHGQPWRMLAIWAPGGEFQVQVAQSLADRERVALEVATQVGLPIVLALPLLALLIYLAVRRAVRPLDVLAHGLAVRSPDNLEALPENGGAPSEVKPLIHALNHLLTRLRGTLENERRFTADAAHELRTPLAAIKIQSQVALASTQETDRLHALRQVQVGTDRASRLVDQLLRLARLDPLAGISQSTDVRLDELATRLADEMGPMARLLGKSLGLVDTPDEVMVRGDEDLLRVALRNLVENALRHTPDGCEVTLGASLEKGLPLLWVRDSGPGVAEDELSRITERFFRGRDVTREGSGLGLAIIRRVAELHGARLELANHPEGGLIARIRWGDAPTPPATGAHPA